MSYRKMDFNVPVLRADGEVQMRQKLDRTKLKNDERGRTIAEPVIGEDGYVVQEPAMLSEFLGGIVDNFYDGEQGMEKAARAERGRVARKVSDRSAGSLKNYTDEELAVITGCMVKVQAQPSILAQVEDMIAACNGAIEDVKSA